MLCCHEFKIHGTQLGTMDAPIRCLDRVSWPRKLDKVYMENWPIYDVTQLFRSSTHLIYVEALSATEMWNFKLDISKIWVHKSKFWLFFFWTFASALPVWKLHEGCPFPRSRWRICTSTRIVTGSVSCQCEQTGATFFCFECLLVNDSIAGRFAICCWTADAFSFLLPGNKEMMQLHKAS